MKFILLSFFGILYSTTSIAQTNSLSVENGVSYSLAVYRKKIISKIHYTLRISIPASKDEKPIGDETISFDLKNTINEALQIDFKNDKESIKNIEVNNQSIPVEFQNEHILVPSKYLSDKNNIIHINFVAGDAALNRHEDYLYTLFVPDRARTMFPCFDQPDLKATFSLTLTIPKNWHAIANAELKDSTSDTSQKTYIFNVSDLIPTYLFSFAAGNFKIVQRDFDNKKITFFYRETDSAKIHNSLDSIFNIYKNSILFYQKWTKILYPFQKEGMVAIPSFQFGGMEHPGAILLQNSSLFLDKNATQDQLNVRSNLIAHEVAHQWFGDMVTMKWFNDVWTKEVFANFMADKSTGSSIDEQTYNLKFLVTHFPSAYSVDRTLGTNPIRQDLDNLENAGMLYGSIIYDKAPIMMRQLELLMGKENFQKGVDEYLEKYKYSNASWQDLIDILSRHTNFDLQSWNKVWVTETGRPIIEDSIVYENEKIKSFAIRQHPEYGNDKVWQQNIAVSFYYPDTVKTINVRLLKNEEEISQAKGIQKPLFVMLNSSGIGYGVWQTDENLLNNFYLIKDAVSRAQSYIALYENMLNAKNISPEKLLYFYVSQLSKENSELNLKLICGYISTIYWVFISPKLRILYSPELESNIWQALQNQSKKNSKKLLFDCYQNIFQTKEAYQNLYHIWQTETPPEGVVLADNDYTNMALSLALRDSSNADLLQQQLARIKDPDRIVRFKIMMQAVSSDSNVRGSFFNSLLLQQNRTNESAITAALYYLHHPLRQATSEKYLPQSLALLQEIKETGDLFFPNNWLYAIFSLYQNADAMKVVENFIKANPNYNPALKNKILQATDNLRRARNLLKE